MDIFFDGFRCVWKTCDCFLVPVLLLPKFIVIRFLMFGYAPSHGASM